MPVLSTASRVPTGSYARTYAPAPGRSYAPTVPATPFAFPGGLDVVPPSPEPTTRERVVVVDGVIFQLQHKHPLGIARVWANVLPLLVARLKAQGTRVVSGCVAILQYAFANNSTVFCLAGAAGSVSRAWGSASPPATARAIHGHCAQVGASFHPTYPPVQ